MSCRRHCVVFEVMVEDVARNAEAASQSAHAAAKIRNSSGIVRGTRRKHQRRMQVTAQKAAASSKTAAQNAATAAERSEDKCPMRQKKPPQTVKRLPAIWSQPLKCRSRHHKAREAAADQKAGAEKDGALSATRAEKAADRAEAAAEVTAGPINIVPPLPDVWIPFNDSLDMIAGFFLRAIKKAIGDDVVQVASDKQVNFSRASTATYINKSGELKAADNEPRFECDGPCLFEGQRTNYMLNSESPASWGKSSNMDVPETGTDSFGFTYGKVCLQRFSGWANFGY